MTQTNIFDLPAATPRCVPCIVPDRDTKAYALLYAMQQGRRFTIKNAGPELGVGALSQEAGRLRNKYGWGDLIKSRWITTPTDSRIKEYFMEAH